MVVSTIRTILLLWGASVAVTALALVLAVGFAHADTSVNYLILATPGVNLEAYVDTLEGFDATNVAMSASGSMVWVRGPQSPALAGGMSILGMSYTAVWANAGTLAIYNSIYSPDAQGNPRPFAAFAGCEKEMGL